MSHWMKGKIALGCSIDILQKALIRINEDWKKHIEIDPEGNLTIEGRNEKYNVVLRNVNKRDYGAPDVGFTKLDDKAWEMDSYDFYDVPNLLGKVTQEVTIMRYEQIAKMENGGQILDISTQGRKKRIVLRTPVAKKYMYES